MLLLLLQLCTLSKILLCRDLHQIPELGFQETETSQYVRYALTSLTAKICTG